MAGFFLRSVRSAPSHWLRPVGPRGWINRALWLTFVAATLCLLIDRFGGRIRLHFAVLAAQREALAYADTPGRLVFDSDSKNADAHLSDSVWEIVTYYQQDDGSFTKTNLRAAVATREVQALNTQLLNALDTVSNWEALRQMPGGSTPGVVGGRGSSGLFPRSVSHSQAIYIGIRAADGCPQRIVTISLTTSCGSLGSDGTVGFECGIAQPATLFHDFSYLAHQTAGTAASGGTRDLVLASQDPDHGVKLFAVSPDPADASRLTFDYEMDGGRGTIEGKLQPNDTISWAILSGPALSH